MFQLPYFVEDSNVVDRPSPCHAAEHERDLLQLALLVQDHSVDGKQLSKQK